jgi:hypothetical protein
MEQQAFVKLQRHLVRKRGIRDALRDYRRARELTGNGLAWRHVKSTLGVFAGLAAPRTRVQVRNLLIRETYPLVERVATNRPATTAVTAATMTADFLRVAYPQLCDDVTPDRVRTLMSRRIGKS